MIKLNNKNITYVALADSNNSLKAPKEIWYADSNNSVKLVYRRKDALIEGEDYEKYHWLKVEVNQKSTMMILPLSTSNFKYSIQLSGNLPNLSYFTTSWHTYGVNETQALVFVYDRKNSSRIYTCPTGFQLGEMINIESSTNELLFNGVSIPMYGYPAENFLIQTNNGIALNMKMTSLYVDGIERYIPVKLLKPVPKWLDANGIRRQAGECGMIDLVSGKFYGNVNSVGTFTVENYYERKEWLVGDGSAYIDTGHNVNEDLDYETKVHLLPNTYLFWYRSGNPYRDQTMVARSDTSQYIGVRTAKNSVDVRADDTANVEIQWNNNEVLVNGVNYTPSNRAITFNYELYLFYAYLADTSIANYSSNNVKCAYFRFLYSNRDYIQNLIPCTLTMDLPASMDANNIARTKGTSGMWDLVSDRFYGNVASSGTFKAVNLAEGVDYEVHQWLRVYMPVQQVSIRYMALPLGSANFSFRRKYVQGNNCQYIQTNGYVYYTNGVKFRIWSSATIFTSNTNLNVGTSDYFQSSESALEFNEESIPIYGYPALTLNFVNASTSDWYPADAEHLTSLVTVDGIERYIPVKLLKSIPSKYDANGIARQAGECGMYDTVNDKFYGNVASSGTFSVSDDE